MPTTPVNWTTLPVLLPESSFHARIAQLVDGRSVVVYKSGNWITAQYLDILGQPDGDPVQLFRDAYGGKGSFYSLPEISAHADGGFTMALEYDFFSPAGSAGVSIARFSADGDRIFVRDVFSDLTGADFTSVSGAWSPASGGRQAAIWNRDTDGGAGEDDRLYLGVYDSAGALVGSVLYHMESSSTSGELPNDPHAITARAGGAGFAVAYVDLNVIGSTDYVRLARYDANGTAIGNSVLLAGDATPQSELDAATLTGGSIIVSWTQDEAGQDIYIRQVGDNGTAGALAARVNTTTAGDQHSSAIGALADGGFVVFWIDGATDSIRGQRFDATATAVGVEFVAAATSGTATTLDVSDMADGRIILNFRDANGLMAHIVDARDLPNAMPVYDPDGAVVGTRLADTIDQSGASVGLTLLGWVGNDTITGGSGADYIDGGSGIDAMSGGLGNDRYIVDTLGDTVSGEIGYSLGGGIDTVLSSVSFTLPSHIELLRLQGTGDISGIGNAGWESLVGAEGDNLLVGNGGNDTLNGKGGDDTLRGGTGRDVLVGEGGRDTFDYDSISHSRAGSATRDFINGFVHGVDTIDLSDIDADPFRAGDQAFDFQGTAGFTGGGAAGAGQLRFANYGGNFVILEADWNGDGTADFQIFVNQTNFMTGTDFVL